MKKMKAVVSLVFIITLGILLAACGGQDESSGESDGKQVEIEFMHANVEQDRVDLIDSLIAKFEEENPGIKVKQVPVEEDSYNTKIVTLANSNQLPEIIEGGFYMHKSLNQDQLIDLESVNRIIQEIGEDNYFKGPLELLKTDTGDGYLAVPISGWVQGIWYNKQIFEENGIQEPATWDEILDAAEKLTDLENKQYGIGLPTVEGQFSEQSFSQFALSNNANVFDGEGNLTLNTPEMKEALEYYKELYKYTMPGSNDTTEVKDAFMNQSAAMAIYSTYILPSVYEEGWADDIGFIVPENKSKAVYGSVSALTVTSGLDDAHREAAEKFILFLMQPDNMTEWVLMAPGGSQPVMPDVLEDPDYQANEVVNAFGDLFEVVASSFDNLQALGLVDGKNIPEMGDVTNSLAIPQMVNRATVGEEDVDQVIADVDDYIRNLLKR